jgi:hypothetical protein
MKNNKGDSLFQPFKTNTESFSTLQPNEINLGFFSTALLSQRSSRISNLHDQQPEKGGSR